MSVQGRVKCTYEQLPSLLEQMFVCTFDERSDRGNAKHLRGSARGAAKRARKCEAFTRLCPRGSEVSEEMRSIYEVLPEGQRSDLV